MFPLENIMGFFTNLDGRLNKSGHKIIFHNLILSYLVRTHKIWQTDII